MAVEDMVGLSPFEGATNRTSIGVFAKGKPVRYPVSYSKWVRSDGMTRRSVPFDSTYEEVTSGKMITARQWQAAPVDRKDLSSAWLAARPRALNALAKVLGKSPYTARAGAFTGGANAVYWLDVLRREDGLVFARNLAEGAKRRVETVDVVLEESLVYPLLRGRDVQRWRAEASAHILMTQDVARRVGIAPNVMHSEHPHAERYLVLRRDVLASRAAYKRYFSPADPYWSMFNVGAYTLSDWKVVWREQAAALTAAVVGPESGQPVVPDHKLMLVAVASESEAHYLCGALNSSPARLLVASYAVEIQMDTHILSHVAIPRFDDRDTTHRRLATLSEAAVQAIESGDSVKVVQIERDVNDAVAALWDLGEQEVADIDLSLADL